MIPMARTSRVSASMPGWTLRHCLDRDARCLRVDHPPSPAALMPVLSVRRCRAPLQQIVGFHDRVLEGAPVHLYSSNRVSV